MACDVSPVAMFVVSWHINYPSDNFSISCWVNHISISSQQSPPLTICACLNLRKYNLIKNFIKLNIYMCLPTFHQICPKSISVYTQFSQKSNCESILPRLSNGCKGCGLQDPLHGLASHLLGEFLLSKKNQKKVWKWSCTKEINRKEEIIVDATKVCLQPAWVVWSGNEYNKLVSSVVFEPVCWTFMNKNVELFKMIKACPNTNRKWILMNTTCWPALLYLNLDIGLLKP